MGGFAVAEATTAQRNHTRKDWRRSMNGQLKGRESLTQTAAAQAGEVIALPLVCRRAKIAGARGAHPVRGKDRSPPDHNNSCFAN